MVKSTGFDGFMSWFCCSLAKRPWARCLTLLRPNFLIQKMGGRQYYLIGLLKD